jgi:type II secretion system protein C
VDGPDLATLLEVKGTVAGTGKDGFAVIEEKGKNKQLLYKVGNVVAGAKVVKITRNAVTFLAGDRERVLKMVNANQAPLLPPRPSGPPAVSPRGAGPMIVSRSEVDASLKDLGTMLSQAQLRPNYTDGVPDGFMITNIKPGSIYEKIGLTNGDIVQGTNDRPLVTADDMTALYNSMKAGTSLTLKIKRGSQQQNLQYVIQ